MKSSFNELIKRLDTAKKRTNDLKTDQKKFTRKERATTTKAKQHQEEWIQELWNNFKQLHKGDRNLRRSREIGWSRRNTGRYNGRQFSKITGKPKLQIQEAYRTPSRIIQITKKKMHLVFKLLKVKRKEKILKLIRKIWHTAYRGIRTIL